MDSLPACAEGYEISANVRSLFRAAGDKPKRMNWRSGARSLGLALLLAMPALGQAAAISFNGTTYTQDFDSLPNSGTNPLVTQAKASPADVPTSTANVSLTGWSFINAAGTGPNSFFRYDDGSSTTGAVYSYGANASTDRALGSLASGTTVSTFGTQLTNTASGAFSSFTISFTGEQWRRGSGAANSLAFSYSFTASDIASGTFITVPELNFTAPITTGGNVTLNGNDPANQTALSFTISNILWNPGQSLTMRWVDVNDAGNDDGLAIDNFSFSAITSAVKTLTWATPGGTWDTTSPDWTGDATVFTNGDIAQFTDAAGGDVEIDAAGISPAQLKMLNENADYRFTGGNLTGSGSLILSGNGTTQLDAESQLTGGTDIQHGTLVIGADERLANNAPVSIGEGAILSLGNFTETIGSLSIKGGTVTADTGKLVLAGSVAVLSSPTTSFIEGALDVGTGNSFTVANGADSVDLLISADIVGGGRVAFSGPGTTELAGDNSLFAGGFSLNAGELQVDSLTSLGTAQFFFNGGQLTTNDAFIGPNAITTPISVGGNVTIDATNPVEFTTFSASFGSSPRAINVIGNVTISGSVAGASVINKVGNGTITLTAPNTYTGNTTVQAGTLKLDGNATLAGTPAIRVDAGATLDAASLAGSFEIVSNQVLRGGGTIIAPGSGMVISGVLAPGGTASGFFTQTLSFQGGNLTLGANSTLQLDLAGTTAGSFDRVVLAQAITLDGQLQISLLSGFVPANTDAFTVLTATGGVSGLFANVTAGRVSFTEGSFAVNQVGNSVVLSDFTPVPEPSVLALLGLTGVGIAWISRRKFRRCR